MAQLGALPQLDDQCEVTLEPAEPQEAGATRFELRVIEVDGRRVARVRLTNLGAAEDEPA